jgi:hypothetical protein
VEASRPPMALCLAPWFDSAEVPGPDAVTKSRNHHESRAIGCF